MTTFDASRITRGAGVPQQQMQFSLIVGTRNRCIQLRELLESFADRFVLAGAIWEVVVVDNASDDATVSAVEQLAPSFPVHLRAVVEAQIGLSHARSRGIAEAQGEVLVFADDDITFDPSWIPSVEQVFQDPRVAIAGGPVVTVYPNSADPAVIEALETDEQGGVNGSYAPGGGLRSLTAAGSRDLPRGGNMAFRREVFERIGDFRKDLGWGDQIVPGEETDFMLRAIEHGHDVWYVPGMSVQHHFQLEKINWDYIRAWHLGYGRASVRMRRNQSRLLRSLKFLEQCFRLVRYAACGRTRTGPQAVRARRKRWQAEGRILESLGR